MSKLIDANVILRYVLNDTEQATLAREVVEEGAYTIPEVLAEVVYVLNGVYQVQREVIADTLFTLLQEIAVEKLEVMYRAIELYGETSLDFVDCILIAHQRVSGKEVFSFDQKLNKQLEKTVQIEQTNQTKEE